MNIGKNLDTGAITITLTGKEAVAWDQGYPIIDRRETAKGVHTITIQNKLAPKIKKGVDVYTRRDIDFRRPEFGSGPFIVSATRGTVLRVQRDGNVWVDFGLSQGIGRRRIRMSDLTAIA